MFKMHREEMDWAGQKLVFETGKIARQAAGAVMVRYGDTCILCTTAIASSPMLYPGFVPLSVHYQEKAFSYGRIPGGFLKRESKPSEQEVLNSRLIDRALRPLFPDSFSYETQVLCTVLSYDLEADPAIAAMNGALASVALSGIPLRKTAGSVRIGVQNDAFVINPNHLILKESPLDLVLSGTSSGILMVESQAQQLSEAQMLDAIKRGHEEICKVIECIDHFVSQAHQQVKTRVAFERTDQSEAEKSLEEKIQAFVKDELQKCAECVDRAERKKVLHDLKERLLAEFSEEPEGLVSGIFHHLWRTAARTKILSSKLRLDGRRVDEIRPIECEVGILPRSHGSALFTRGNTQALVAVTLGGKEEGQLVESAMGTWRDSFLLNYNFPPFSVGEVGKIGSPGRREVGHGRLAWRALASVIPQNKAEFPYTLRVVSEITESYGSSSMATVCGGSLALMDAGVPLEAPVAGIAMGLICDNDTVEILSDISGTEDSLGDMDFKVAGTEKGITALQMDLKIDSLSMEIFEKALKQALVGRHHILKVMKEQTLSESRETLSAYAPCVRVLKIPKDRIRDLIGPGGKNIKEICETTGVKIDVDDNGNVSIFGHTLSASEEAEGKIIMATGSSPEVGKIYDGVVVKLIEVGAFVKFGFADDGFVHISEVTPTRLNNINDALTVGDKVRVQCIGFDQRGRIKLSIKQAAVQASA